MIEIKKKIITVLILLLTNAAPCFAHNIEYGYSVRVGIIDSGADIEKIHVAGGYNILEDSDNIADNKGHGTKVAQIVLSVAPKAEIIALKCTEQNLNSDNTAIIKAIYKAVDDYGCDVLNISIGMPDSQELKNAVDYAASKGCIIVSAVGNDGEISYKKGKIYYPAGYENAVGVGAVDENGVVCRYSQKNKSVFVTATSLEGTSFAAAEITGAAAVAKQFDKRITPVLFMKFLKESVTDSGIDGYDTSYGYGIFDFNALEKNLADRYSLLAAEESDGLVTVCNLKDSEVSAKVIFSGDNIDCKEILLRQGEKTQIDINDISKCFIWQNSIYDIVWIKKGELR